MNRKQSLSLLLAGAVSLSLMTLPALAVEPEPAAPPATREEAALQAAQAAAQYGGAVSIQYALWEDGEITLSGHSGVYSRTENRALTEDTLYSMSSISKVYTTAAVMKLVEAGKVDLDKPVTTYLPDFKMADERYKDITVRMLLAHSSGLMGSTGRNGFLLNDPENTSAARDLLARLSTQRLKADPGAFSVYCNDGFTLAELVMERVSGQSFRDFVHKNILDPHGLTQTHFPSDSIDTSLTAKTYLGAETPALPWETVGLVGTGGLYTTATDLASFGGLFCGETLLTSASVDAMAQPMYSEGLWPEDEEDMMSYGLGWDSVNAYPFAYSGIQALVKAGDTRYHSSLVVLPEYNMAAAVLSSGGASTFNQFAATRMLIDALKERGVTVDEAPHAVPPSEPAPMPKELTAFSGIYGNSSFAASAAITEDGRLTLHYEPLFGIPDQVFTYRADGGFHSEEAMGFIKPVTAANGQVYLWQKAYTDLPGLGEIPTSSYYMEKLPDNTLSDEVRSVWESRGEKLYLLLNETYTSLAYPVIITGTTVPLADSSVAPGYLANALQVVDADNARSVVQIPGLNGRDVTDLSYRRENGLEYLEAASSLYVESAVAKPICTDETSYCTILDDGYSRWFQTGAGAGKVMSVQLPEKGGFTVYDANGAAMASSWAYGDTSLTLPENGWIVFAGEPGARFHLTMSET